MRGCRIPDMIAAAAFGAGRWLVAFGLSLMLALPLLRLATSYALRGSLAPAPISTPRAASGEPAITGATPDQEERINAALAELSLRFDPSSVNVRVVDALPCDQCAAAYLPEIREVLVPRNVADTGGPTLRWALAHELGHHVDSRYMTDELRERFGEIRGYPDDVSWLALDLPWEKRPSEDFAEVFAVLVQPTVDRPVGTAYGRVRDREEIEALLAEAHLTRGEAPSGSPWTAAVADQGRYLGETLKDPGRLAGVQALAVGMAALGALRGAASRGRLAACGPPTPAWW